MRPSVSSETVQYRERLSPSPALYLLALLAGGGAALLGSLWGPLTAGVFAVVAIIGVAIILTLAAPVIEVVRGGDRADGGGPEDLRLHAGGAVIPVTALGAADVVDADGLRRLLGTEADTRAHVCHRPWIRSAVRFDVADPRDSTPYWLVCTRRPAQLIQAAHSEQIS